MAKGKVKCDECGGTGINEAEQAAVDRKGGIEQRTCVCRKCQGSGQIGLYETAKVSKPGQRSRT